MDDAVQIASRFAVAVHILSLLGNFPDAENTSEWLSGSIGVNPVVVRNVTGMLRRNGIVATQQGVAGTQLAKPLSSVTLFDVYKAVRAVEEELFSVHQNPNPNCVVGANIQTVLEREFAAAQDAMEVRLSKTTMEEVVRQLRKEQLNDT